MRTDNTNPVGKRTLFHGQPELLRGFQLNTRNKLNSVSTIPFVVRHNHNNCMVTIEIPPFKPASQVFASAAVTHFRIVLVGAMINPGMDFYDSDSRCTDLIPLTEDCIPTSTLAVKTAKPEGFVNLVAIGVEFYEVVNKRKYPANADNALEIVKVIKWPSNLKTR